MPDTLEIRKVPSCKIYFYEELKAYCNITNIESIESNKSVGRDSIAVQLGHGARLILNGSFAFITKSPRDDPLHILHCISHNSRPLKAAGADGGLAIIFQNCSFLVYTTSVLEIIPEYLCDKEQS